MLARVQIKELIREEIFQIYEAFERKDMGKISDIQWYIVNKIQNKEWKGKKYPLKDFTYEFMKRKYKITYGWRRFDRMVPRRIKVRNYYGGMSYRDNPNGKKRKESVVVMSHIYITEVQKIQYIYEKTHDIRWG